MEEKGAKIKRGGIIHVYSKKENLTPNKMNEVLQ